MEYRRLGKTEMSVSALCLGTMQFGWTADENTSRQILEAAFAEGINFLDTADIYSNWVPGNPGGVSEEIIGRWLRAGGIRREQLVIATKVRGRTGPGPDGEGLSRAHIFQAAEDSLRRLRTDYIDLYLAHWFDEHTPIEETLRAFDDLIRQGKVRSIGASNYPAERFREALETSARLQLARYECLEPHYNLVRRAEFEAELAALCRTHEMGVLPYSPLAGGFLSGKYRRGEPLPQSLRAAGVTKKYLNDEGWALLERVEYTARSQAARSQAARGQAARKQVARKRSDVSPSQIALAWLLANPLVTSPIIGPRSLDQLSDNLAALDISMSAAEIEYLEEIG